MVPFFEHNVKPLWLHIGLAKTATTSLQRLLFSRHPQIGYLGKNWIEDERAKQALLHMARGTDRKFDASEVQSAFGELLRRYDNDEADPRVFLLSEEDLTTFRFIDPRNCARRARMIFPNARILLIIRDPIEWLQSMYFFRLSLRFPETLDGFNPWLRKGLEQSFVRTDIGQVQIGTLVDAYADCFGTERLTILRYEDFATDAEAFITAVSELLGVDAGMATATFGQSESRYKKSRITENQRKFLEKYRLVVAGCYREYLEETAPLVASLEKRVRHKAEEMMLIDFGSEPAMVRTRFKELSIFLDRACRAQLQEGQAATAEMDIDLKERIMAIWEPGARDIAARFNPRVNAYFGQATAQ